LSTPSNPKPERSFYAALYHLDAAAKKATFYLMNTSRNRNNWGITEAALDEALPTLPKKPLGMGQGYKIDSHYPDGTRGEPKLTMEVGEFTVYENKGRYAFGTATITDDQTLTMLKTGELAAVSVVVTPYYETCSYCWEVLDSWSWQEHECIKTEQGYALVHSFVFERVDFVDKGAYPQAGFMEFAALQKQKTKSDQALPLSLFASAYEFSQPKQKPKPKVNVMDEKILEQKLAELQKGLTNVTDAVTALSGAFKTMRDEAQAEKTAQAQKEANDLVEDVFLARIQAGLTTEAARVPETKKLAACNKEALQLLLAEAKAKPTPEPNPRQADAQIKYPQPTPQDISNLEAALQIETQKLGFPPTPTPTPTAPKEVKS